MNRQASGEHRPGAGDRGAQVARAFHRDTIHTPVSVRGGGTRLDWANKPLPVKIYPDVQPRELPRSWPEPDTPAVAALSGAGSSGPDGGRRDARQVGLDLAGLARLLFLSAGVSRTRASHPHPVFMRTAPSAGGLYPVECYLVCADREGLPAGVYHFEPVEFVLRQLRDGDHRAYLAAAAAADEVATTSASLVLTGVLWRTSWKYGPRGWRHLYWDAGTILANTLTAAAAAGLEARVLAGFVDDRVGRLLDLPAAPFEEWPLAVVPLGPADGRAPTAASVPPLNLRVAPLSDRQVPEPDAREVQQAGALADPQAVEDWRRTVRGLSGRRASTVERSPDRHASVQQVILQRGSTRRFDQDATLEEEAVSWGMAVADRCQPLDATPEDTSLLDHLLAVHAVEGVSAGAYRWRAEGPLRLGDADRRTTAHLCLDQPLGGTSAFTCFHSADLESLLSAGGARTYRVAELAAGIAAGRLQLASFALGHGGTGLTFYDREVSDFFDTTAAPMLVAAIGQPAYEASRGRHPDEQSPVRFDR